MTPSSFRKIALSFPEVEERSHQAHPDFRVRGKIFATLDFPKPGWGMAFLAPSVQKQFIDKYSNAFSPANGYWGRRGCTMIKLSKATTDAVRKALIAAWRNKAPKKLAALVDVQ
ncbi:MAG: MmcQ/YjbR family DNA-binding protein [Ignavibacteriae bacterium]|nr:MmcQ/YjbR family DNA-binding protein [Ignavibacteriota bacterium]